MDKTEMRFSCKGCVFSETVEVFGKQIQNGCLLNRVDKLNPEKKFEDDEKSSYFTFNRFCNAYRPEIWASQHHMSNGVVDIEGAIQGVKEEILPRLSIIIDFNYDLDLLKKNFEIINNQQTSRKFVVVINDKVEYNLEIFAALNNLYLNKKIVQYHIVMPSEERSIYYNIDDSLKFCKNGWMVFIDKGDTIPVNLTETINHRVNVEMRRLVYAEKSNKTFLVQSAIYKLLGGNSPKMLENGEMDNRDWLTRIHSLKANDPDCLISWESIFNE